VHFISGSSGLLNTLCAVQHDVVQMRRALNLLQLQPSVSQNRAAAYAALNRCRILMPFGAESLASATKKTP
jgi:hypothetical protein